MKKYLLVIMAATILLIGGCQDKKEEAKEDANKETIQTAVKKEMPVVVEKIAKTSIQKIVKTNTELEAIKEVKQITKFGGDVDKVYFKNGDKVKKGDVIVKMSDDSITMNYRNAAASYESAKAAYEESEKFAEKRIRNQLASSNSALVNAKQTLERAKRGVDTEELAQAKATMESANKNYEVQKNIYEKYQKLYEKKLVSETEYLNIENNYKTAESTYINAKNQVEILLRGEDKETIAKLEAAYELAKEQYELSKKYVEDESWKYEIAAKKAQYDTAKSSYDYAKKSYDDMTVKAEIGGIVAGLDLTEGDTIAKETYLFTVIDDSKMEGKSGINGEDLAGVEVGKEINIFVADINKSYKGKISEVSPKADPQTRKFGLKFVIENDGMLRSGMYAKVDIPTIVKETLVIPAKSIVIKDLAEYVFLAKENKASKIKITTGISSGDKIEVVSEKINAGDMIIVDGQYLLDDQDSVRIVENR